MPTSPPAFLELDLAFRAVDAGSTLHGVVPAMLEASWPAYRSWFLRDGEAARPSYAEGRWALETYLPALVPTYDALLAAVGADDLQARFLSQWCPPPVATACSLASWSRDARVLVRNYDYPPLLCDTTALASSWNGARTLAMADCLWGAVDGMNEHGLAVAIAFGGRPVVGPGFGIGLVVRYLLEFCRDVREALEVLRRVPVSMSYNVALLDRRGSAVVVRVAPDRPASVAPRVTAANRQGSTEWPEHSIRCATVERERALDAVAADPGATAGDVVQSFLTAPVHRDPALTPWGTVYTAVYAPDLGTLDLMWPGEAPWRLHLHEAVAGVRHRRVVTQSASVEVALPHPAAAPSASTESLALPYAAYDA